MFVRQFSAPPDIAWATYMPKLIHSVDDGASAHRLVGCSGWTRFSTAPYWVIIVIREGGLHGSVG
ncbi:hypothetical protein A4G28_03080 [Mycobacterium ostraviense]|uniref:Uncharacterized protein n=1 Tax=Mycobacterium ostraviense TaxID=2738409 RepID=A0A163U4V1_9MYCO|nr:hypothetical protein A4G28_03080 [Mycobacterium ostraviense]